MVTFEKISFKICDSLLDFSKSEYNISIILEEIVSRVFRVLIST